MNSKEEQAEALKKADNGEELSDKDIDALCDWVLEQWDELDEQISKE